MWSVTYAGTENGYEIVPSDHLHPDESRYSTTGVGEQLDEYEDDVGHMLGLCSR